MTASNELICFPECPLPETAMGLLCNCSCLMGALPLPLTLLRDPIIPLVRSKGYPPRNNDLTRPPVAATAPSPPKEGMHPGCLAHFVRVIFTASLPTHVNPTYTYIYTYIHIDIPGKQYLGGYIGGGHPAERKTCLDQSDIELANQIRPSGRGGTQQFENSVSD